jgi:hypothetical protein
MATAAGANVGAYHVPSGCLLLYFYRADLRIDCIYRQNISCPPNMLFTDEQLDDEERTAPMQQLLYMMSSRFRAANRALRDVETVDQEEAWVKMFQREVVK